MQKKVIVVFGTRPEAIKMAPVVQELQQTPWVDCRIVVTAQHREMLDQVLRLFAMEPHHDLAVMRPGQSLFDVTSRALRGLEEIYRQEKPDFVLVHGDTTTTFVGALAAYYLQIPVGHVEAGLRTGNKYSPFPEEMNRRLAGILADLHFAPTAGARRNLQKEGIPPETIKVTGNTVIDALLSTVRKEYVFDRPELAAAASGGQRLLLVTTHRRENLGEPLRGVYRALRRILTAFPDTTVVFPVHLNPAVREVVREELDGNQRVILTEPLSYLPFVKLMQAAHVVLTDSGGLQEEAPALGKPVILLRDTTERPEALSAGTVSLTGLREEAVWRETARLLADAEAYQCMASATNPFGDGQAAARIVGFLGAYFGQREAPAEFDQKIIYD